MSIFKSIRKGIGKVFKKIGKKIKKVAMKVGKFMNKIGIVGQIALMFIPGVGQILGSLGKMAGAAFQGVSTALGASGNAIARGLGHVMSRAAEFAGTAKNAFSTVTEGITGFVKKVGGTVLEKAGVKATTDASFNSVGEAFQSWTGDVATNATKTVDAFKGTFRPLEKQTPKSFVGVPKDIEKNALDKIQENLGSKDLKPTIETEVKTNIEIEELGTSKSKTPDIEGTIKTEPTITTNPNNQSAETKNQSPELESMDAVKNTLVEDADKSKFKFKEYVEGIYKDGKKELAAAVSDIPATIVNNKLASFLQPEQEELSSYGSSAPWATPNMSVGASPVQFANYGGTPAVQMTNYMYQYEDDYGQSFNRLSQA